MKVPFAIGITLVAAIVMSPVVLCAHRYQASKKALEEATQDLESAASSIQEVLDLRAAQQVVGIQQRPTQDVIAQVNSVLADVGIPSNQLRSLTPESNGLVNQSGDAPGPKLKRQLLRLNLENVSVGELGGFLDQWRTVQSMWTVSRIELTHVRDQNPANSRFDVNLLISAVYLADP